jgi:hypothetical protein
LTPTCTRRHFLLIELLQNGELHLATYAVKGGDRRSVKVASGPFKRARVVETTEPAMSAVWVEMQEGMQLALVDLSKMRVVAMGFYGESLLSVKSHPTNVNILTVCTRSFVKNLEVKDGGFELSN